MLSPSNRCFPSETTKAKLAREAPETLIFCNDEDRKASYVFLLIFLLLVHHPVGQELVALSVVVIVHLGGELAAEGQKPQR